jgi:NifU-like protein involved in Fe-S cluster formation
LVHSVIQFIMTHDRNKTDVGKREVAPEMAKQQAELCGNEVSCRLVQ